MDKKRSLIEREESKVGLKVQLFKPEQSKGAAVKLPLEMGVLSFVQNVDKELRNGGKASTCGIHAGI